MNTFQVVLLVVFGAFLVIGVLIFASGHLGNQAGTPDIVLWGSVSTREMRDLLEQLDIMQRDILKVVYVYKEPEHFTQELTEAIATGHGPDLAIISNDQIVALKNKLTLIPFTSLPDREVKDTYIQEVDLFRTVNGYFALPFSVDPLVMYWNRDIFQSAGLAKAPQYWDEFASIITSLTIKDQSANISKSAIAFGEYVNVSNAKSILTSLIMQAGNPITLLGRDESGAETLSAVLDQKFASLVLPADAAIDFYTQFADPAKPIYSWNRSLPVSVNMFLSGDLATYFGFASEYPDLQKKNPNLNFDVAPFPQSRNATKITFGRMTGIAIVRSSPNVAEAYRSLRVLTSQPAAAYLSNINGLPPPRRDLLSATTTRASAIFSVFSSAALQSRAWLDPNPESTDKIFSDMIESIKSGSEKTTDAVGQANEEIDNLIKSNVY